MSTRRSAAGKGAKVLDWAEWLASEQGQRCVVDLPMSTQYLVNRLWWAFAAGVKFGELRRERGSDGRSVK